MENEAKGRLVDFVADWLASNGHGSAESLIPRVEEGVDLLIGAVREAAEQEGKLEFEPLELEEAVLGMREARAEREAEERTSLYAAGLMPPFRELRPAGMSGALPVPLDKMHVPEPFDLEGTILKEGLSGPSAVHPEPEIAAERSAGIEEAKP